MRARDSMDFPLVVGAVALLVLVAVVRAVRIARSDRISVQDKTGWRYSAEFRLTTRRWGLRGEKYGK